MNIEMFTVGSFAMNCYLVYDEKSREAVYIDPGAEAQRLITAINDKNLILKFVINTHCHIDHTAEVEKVLNHFDVPFYIHKGDLGLLNSLKEQGDFFGIGVDEIPGKVEFVEDGDHLQFGETHCQILHTPGHSPGGISIRIGTNVFVGDCLFYDSIGRTDLPGGDSEQLLQSIHDKLLTLDNTVRVFPGHGPSTTIGRERNHNPFLR